MGKRYAENFVTPGPISNYVKFVLLLVFSTYLASVFVPDYEFGKFKLEMTHAGEDLLNLALLSTDPAHFEEQLQSRSRKIVLPPIPGQDEEEAVLQSRRAKCITYLNSFDEPLIKGRKLCDRHNTKSLFGLKPDDVFYCGEDDDAHVMLNELYILCLGEIKKPRTTDDVYTPEEYLQLVNYLILLLRKQAKRIFAYGY